jgi:hypothetical protein
VSETVVNAIAHRDYTSNLVFSQRNPIFTDAMTPAAAIERRVHHSTIPELTNESYRIKSAEGGFSKN